SRSRKRRFVQHFVFVVTRGDARVHRLLHHMDPELQPDATLLWDEHAKDDRRTLLGGRQCRHLAYGKGPTSWRLNLDIFLPQLIVMSDCTLTHLGKLGELVLGVQNGLMHCWPIRCEIGLERYDLILKPRQLLHFLLS